MAYGLGRALPEDNQELIRRLSMRYLRAAGPHNVWAKSAKQCIEFLEGIQWTEEQLAEMRDINRSALTINKIAPLFRLVMGYQSSNRLDVNYLPTSNAQSSEDIGRLLTALYKIESGRIDLPFVDTEVFADGLSGGRGFWDMRLDFEENELGELAVRACDPFSIYVDPDADMYDLDRSAAFIQETVWTDVDSINADYGSDAALAVENVMHNSHNSSMLSYMGEEDVSPERYYGQYANDKSLSSWGDVYHTDFVDKQAKRIRLLDTQYKIKKMHPNFIDLDVGVSAPIPDSWLLPENQHKIDKALEYTARKGANVIVQEKITKRVRWTVSCADVLLHDKWSPYESYTQVGYFPYFRRGKTRGMLNDLIDPQMEINKKRSVITDILNRNANSGWIYEEQSMDSEQEENLRRYGSAPGINVKWKRRGQNAEAPKRIEPGGYPQGLDRLEQKAQDDLSQISGINDSAMGQLDRVQSGRAIEARQRQAVLAIQPYHDNFTRSKKLCGKRTLEIFQNHYTEERYYRMMGEDSKLVEYEINKKMLTGTNSFERINDINVGRYATHVDETPVSATFKQAQFEEMMALLEKLGPIGMMLAQTSPHLIIDQTSLPRKDEWKQGLMAAVSETALAGEEGIPQGGAPVQTGTPEQMPS